MTDPDVRIAPDATTLTAVAAAEIAAGLRAVLASQESATMALASSAAIAPIMTRLASHYSTVVDWAKVRLLGNESQTGPASALAGLVPIENRRPLAGSESQIDIAVLAAPSVAGPGGWDAVLAQAARVVAIAPAPQDCEALAASLATSRPVTWFVSAEAAA